MLQPFYARVYDKKSKGKVNQLPKQLPVFDKLIEHTICDVILDKQEKEDAKKYCITTLAHENPSIYVIIKKSRHTQSSHNTYTQHVIYLSGRYY